MTAPPGHPFAPVGRQVALGDQFNSVGCAFPGVDTPEGLDGFGRAYPAEELDALGLPVPTGWGYGAADNVVCDGQRVDLAGTFEAVELRMLGAGAGGSLADQVLVERGDTGRFSLEIGLSDFLAIRPRYGETLAAECSVLRERGHDIHGPRPRLWLAVARFGEPFQATTLTLPVNPAMHVFALWLCPAPAGGEGP